MLDMIEFDDEEPHDGHKNLLKGKASRLLMLLSVLGGATTIVSASGMTFLTEYLVGSLIELYEDVRHALMNPSCWEDSSGSAVAATLKP